MFLHLLQYFGASLILGCLSWLSLKLATAWHGKLPLQWLCKQKNSQKKKMQEGLSLFQGILASRLISPTYKSIFWVKKSHCGIPQPWCKGTEVKHSKAKARALFQLKNRGVSKWVKTGRKIERGKQIGSESKEENSRKTPEERKRWPLISSFLICCIKSYQNSLGLTVTHKNRRSNQELVCFFQQKRKNCGKTSFGQNEVFSAVPDWICVLFSFLGLLWK